MYYEEEFFLAEDYGRRRRPNRDVELECNCSVLGGTDHNPECGCGRQDPDRTEKHVYHHIVDEKSGHRKESCENCGSSEPTRQGCCDDQSCYCQQLRNMMVNTPVTLILEGATIPIPGIFMGFDNKTCCATFSVAAVAPLAAGTLIVDCKKIQALLLTTIGG
ncbi:hypothetical protein J14TS2_54020 [Bacillus sp. J14TS2]|uniref:hypothetical protein n=1 Tax=Bacillus sp. J14TS2 TaxID=2807188 RepID=UPI001B124A1A|nr:hypothetical protein [Bacillus sp. J14TS2]GIN74927.1 hypothetical protein J14TS2_54020 [Bacillus sp. J14TS2]